jgi:cell division protein FtsN
MRSEAIKRPRVARPRRDTIAVTVPKNAIWMALGGVVAFGALSFVIGLWIGRGTADRPAPVSTRVVLSNAAPPPAPSEPAPVEEPIEEPIEEAAPVPPPEPKKRTVELDIRERPPRGRHGLQVGAFSDRQEAQRFLEAHAADFEGLPIYLPPAKVGSKGLWYRVRVGSFVDKEEAEKARRALPEDVAKGSMVVRYR